MEIIDRILIHQTRNFAVFAEMLPEYDLDLSWCDDEEERERIERGYYAVFCARVVVVHRPTDNELGDDYLSGCIYNSFSEFVGMRGHYIEDMVSEAISRTREHISSLCAAGLHA